MLFILLGLALLSAILYPASRVGSCDGSLKSVLKNIFAELFFIALLFISFFSLYSIETSFYEEVLDSHSYELLPISDDAQNSNTPYYTRVSIDDHQFRSFYFKYYDGQVEEKCIIANNSTICYDDACTPHMVKTITYTRNKVSDFWLILLTFGYYGISNQINEIYEIYIPTSSVFVAFE